MKASIPHSFPGQAKRQQEIDGLKEALTALDATWLLLFLMVLAFFVL